MKTFIAVATWNDGDSQGAYTYWWNVRAETDTAADQKAQAQAEDREWRARFFGEEDHPIVADGFDNVVILDPDLVPEVL